MILPVGHLHQDRSLPGSQGEPLDGRSVLPDLFTFREAMARLRVSRSTIYRLMESGQLPGHKVGSTWRFSAEDLRACVREEKRGKRPDDSRADCS